VPSAWLARDLAGLDAWIRQGATLPARLFGTLGDGPDTGISQAELLPDLPEWNQEMATALAHRALEDMAFCAVPDWRGAPAETGAIARTHRQPLVAEWMAQRGRGMGARLMARLYELADLPRRMQAGGTRSIRAWSIGEGVGIAGVETSRGLLFHVASLHDGKVADYRILAPTEWNFHPAGPLAQALSGLNAPEGLDALARMVSRSLDPCVGFGVEIVNA
jgi:coenzyme F420-reducing hydrogenase alpha subunit